MWIPGIDVSHFQGVVDWTQVAASGMGFCFIKATEGLVKVTNQRGILDPRFAQNWAGSSAAGLTRGAYHFGHPGGDAIIQAQFFFDTVGVLGPNDLPPVLDIETMDEVDAQTALQWVLDFTAKADELFARQTLIYTDNGFWNNLSSLPACEPLGTRPLWIADYAANPTVPAPWQSWSCWQYSEDAAKGASALPRVPGVNAPVDRNWFQSVTLQALTSPSTESQGLS
jgi:lysozyme